MVGVARYSDYPEAARQLPLIGDAARVDIERVLALKPDLILGWKSGNPARDLARLERLGYAVFVTEPRRLPDIARLLRAIGELAGTMPDAARAADGYSNRINELRKSYGGRPVVRVFYEIWHRPLLTVSGEHMINDVIELCGGRNVLARARGLTPVVSLESVLASGPAAIIGGGSMGGERAFAGQWRTVRAGRLRETPAYYVDPDAIQRPTPRIVEGARAICAHLETVRTAAR